MADNVVWTVELEVALFDAMRRHKPVGVNKHFEMIFIESKLNSSLTKKIDSKEIWRHLGTLYDLNALNESEIMPFPNKEFDFEVPEDMIKDKDLKESNHKSETKYSKGSAEKPADKNVERIKEEVKESPASGTPKSRKRTRGTTLSPAANESTPTSSKRARRT